MLAIKLTWINSFTNPPAYIPPPTSAKHLEMYGLIGESQLPKVGKSFEMLNLKLKPHNSFKLKKTSTIFDKVVEIMDNDLFCTEGTIYKLKILGSISIHGKKMRTVYLSSRENEFRFSRIIKLIRIDNSGKIESFIGKMTDKPELGKDFTIPLIMYRNGIKQEFGTWLRIPSITKFITSFTWNKKEEICFVTEGGTYSFEIIWDVYSNYEEPYDFTNFITNAVSLCSER